LSIYFYRVKKIACQVIAAVLFITTHSQTLQEWTQQKKTQIQYLLNQIAANKVYLDYLQKGYVIVSDGLTTINNSKKGDFNLHRDFIGSQKTVNPAITNSAKVAAIIALQIKIIKESKQSLSGIRSIDQFTTSELDHCSMVFDRLLDGCHQNIEELFYVMTDGELTMKDDERLNRIDKLCQDMQSKYAFCASFGNEIWLLAIQRMNEQIEIDQSKIIKGLK